MSSRPPSATTKKKAYKKKDLPPTNSTLADRGGEHPDKKTFVKTPMVGTDVDAVLAAGKHVVPVTVKGAAVLEAMEAKAAASAPHQGGKDEQQSLVAKVKHAAATSCEFITESNEEYIKIKAAEDVAATEGVYKTQGERHKKGEEQKADLVEIWPMKEDVRQLESMVEHAGSVHGISLRKGGPVARLQSAADRGTSCKVPKKVADLLIDATINRPLDLKMRAEARVTRMEHGVAGGAGEQTRKPMPELVRGSDNLFTVNVPVSPSQQVPQGAPVAGAGPEEESN